MLTELVQDLRLHGEDVDNSCSVFLGILSERV